MLQYNIADPETWRDLANAFYNEETIRKYSLTNVVQRCDFQRLVLEVQNQLKGNSMWALLDLPIQELQEELKAEEKVLLLG